MGSRIAKKGAETIEALVSVLLPVAAAMVKCDLSAGTLIHAAKVAYVRAAAAEMKATQSRLNVSRISVVTGLTRKEVRALLNEVPDAREPSKRPLEHRAIRVLRGWTTDPLYTTDGKPAELTLAGQSRNFTTLVRAYAGDVPTKAVLRELERLNAVAQTSAGKLRLRRGPSEINKKPLSRLRDWSGFLVDFCEAATYSVASPDPASFFSSKVVRIPTEGEAAKFRELFGRRAALLLDGIDHWEARHRNRRRSAPPELPMQNLAVGLYLLQYQNADKSPARTRGRSKPRKAT